MNLYDAVKSIGAVLAAYDSAERGRILAAVSALECDEEEEDEEDEEAEPEQDLLALLAEHGEAGVRTGVVCETLGLSVYSWKVWARELAAAGTIEVVGTGAGTRYRVAP